LRPVQHFPEGNYISAKCLNTLVELLIQLIHSDEILSVEVSILLIRRAMHINLVNFVYLPKKVLFIDAMAVLVKLREPMLNKTSHLEYA
jgi:hypothetical protein